MDTLSGALSSMKMPPEPVGGSIPPAAGDRTTPQVENRGELENGVGVERGDVQEGKGLWESGGLLDAPGVREELRRTAQWVAARGFRHVCLQVLEEDLRGSPAVAGCLKGLILDSLAERGEEGGTAGDSLAQGGREGRPSTPPPPTDAATPAPTTSAPATSAPDTSAPAAQAQQVEVYVIADGAEGRRCCADEVSARHVIGAGTSGCIVHLGSHACMTPTLFTPTRYIFPRQPLDVPRCATALLSLAPPPPGPPPTTVWVVLSALPFSHALPGLQEEVTAQWQRATGGNCEAPFVFGRLKPLVSEPPLVSAAEPSASAQAPRADASGAAVSAPTALGGCCGDSAPAACCRTDAAATASCQSNSAASGSCQDNAAATASCHQDGQGCTSCDNRPAGPGCARNCPGCASGCTGCTGNSRESGRGSTQQGGGTGATVTYAQGAWEWDLPVPSGAREGTGKGKGEESVDGEEGESGGAEGGSERESEGVSEGESEGVSEGEGRKVGFIWVGPETPTLTTLALTHNSCQVSRWDAATCQLAPHGLETSRALRRRYYLVEKAKDAAIVGIVVSAAGLAGARETVWRVKALAEASGTKVYVIAMSRVTPAKLANFPECEVMVVVACPESVLFDSKEYYAPIITPFEAELAFGKNMHWTGEYRLSMDVPASGGGPGQPEIGVPQGGGGAGAVKGVGEGEEEGEGEEGATNEPRFSLIQGGYTGGAPYKPSTSRGGPSSDTNTAQPISTSGDGNSTTAVAVRPSGAVIPSAALSSGKLLVHPGYSAPVAVSSGSEFLAGKREYKGMEAPWFMSKKEGEPGAGVFQVQEEIGAEDAVPGKSGRAWHYQGEEKRTTD